MDYVGTMIPESVQDGINRDMNDQRDMDVKEDKTHEEWWRQCDEGATYNSRM